MNIGARDNIAASPLQGPDNLTPTLTLVIAV
jgi:hypothetical protein